MAAPVTIPFEDFIVRIGNGATPEVFTAPCAFMSRSFKAAVDTVDTTVPDCDDETVAPWVRRRAATKSAEVNGEGKVSGADIATWRGFLGSAPKNCEVMFDIPGAQGGGYYRGPFVLTSWEISVEDKDVATLSVSLSSAGDLTWTSNA